jgi:hypothetical protein
MNMRKMSVSAILCLLGVTAGYAGYGDKINGYPIWQERVLLVLTNACRMAPQQYRDAYVGNSTILQPANYKAVPPVYWNQALNTAARFHCIQMADTCGMTHNSCNGTDFSTRMQSFYKNKNGMIGENIATGYADPVSTMQQWLLDKDTAGRVAVDLSMCPPYGRCDGHRWNIMNKAYKEIGIGYAYGAKPYRYFWDQDFAGGKTEFNNPIVSASHFFYETAKTTFMANYFDSLGKPSEASLFIDNQKTSLSLAMGADSAGSYVATIAKASSCRYYYFTFTDVKAKQWRYPETGFLVTQGEGTCAKDFVPAESLVVHERNRRVDCRNRTIETCLIGSMLVLKMELPDETPFSTSIVTVQGKEIKAHLWNRTDDNSQEHLLSLNHPLAEGSYYAVHRFSDGMTVVRRLVVLRY